MNYNLPSPQKVLYRILNIISLIVLTAVLLYLIITWRRIPDIIPTHFNGTGEADAWNGKGTLLILPVFAILTYGITTLIERCPDVWNTGVKLTPQNQNRVLSSIRGLITTTKLALVLVFAWIIYCSASCINLGRWFVPVSLCITFGPMVYYVIKIYHIPANEK